MTHRACRSRARAGHQTVTGPVTSTCSRDRWGRAETERTALGEALVMRRRTRVRFPPPPPRGPGEVPGPLLARSRVPPRTAVAPGSRRLRVPTGSRRDEDAAWFGAAGQHAHRVAGSCIASEVR